MVLLQTIDSRWKEHLAQIDQLKEGINLRAYAQKDPLIEYKKESFKLFEALNHAIRSEAIEKLLKVQIVARESEALLPQQSVYNMDAADYAGSEGNTSYFDSSSSLPLAASPESGSGRSSLSHSSGQGPLDEGRKMNRAERRRHEKKSKKGKLRV